jgi:chromosomal replication initiator protein
MAEMLTRAEVLRTTALMYVKRELGVSVVDLVSRRRQAELVRARALFVWIVRSHNPADPVSYPTIAAWLGGRDHTTIMHAFRTTAPQLRQRSMRFRVLCEAFELEPAFKENSDGDTCH